MKLSEAIYERTIALENLIEAKATARDLMGQLLDDSLLESIDHTATREALRLLMITIEDYQRRYRACRERVAELHIAEIRFADMAEPITRPFIPSSC